MENKDEAKDDSSVDLETQAICKGLLDTLGSDKGISFEKVPYNPYLKFLLTSKKIYQNSLGPNQSSKEEYSRSINKYDANLRMDSKDPTQFSTFLDTYYPFDNPKTKHGPQNAKLKPTISYFKNKMFSKQLLSALIRIFSKKKITYIPHLNVFEFKIVNMILSKIIGSRVCISNNLQIKKLPGKIRKVNKFNIILKEQYKKYAFKAIIYIMKLEYDFIGNSIFSNNDQQKVFNKKFSEFLCSNFARKSQKLDQKDFESEFYKTVFADVLFENTNARVYDFVCPTSSRPTLEKELTKTLKNPEYVSKKLPSRFCTINSPYFETIFESRNFSKLFDDILKHYFDRFTVSQIRNKFEILMTSWINTFIRTKHDKGPIEILRIIRDQIKDNKIKLAWPLCKSRIARKILKREFKSLLLKEDSKKTIE